jgi:cullin 1
MNRVRIPMVSLEESHNPKRVEEDRNAQIEACIMRIMKSRKTLGHTELMGEVFKISTLFQPKNSAIKKHIESLIDREYLERDTSATNVYKYLA